MSARRFVTVVIVLVTLVPGMAGAQGSLRERVDAQVRPYIDAGALSSAVVGIVRGDETLVAGYGTVGDGPPDGDTVYEIGSVSKVFTGILLADAVLRGEVRLDEPVDDLLPDGVVLRQMGDDPVTLLQLSTHTSGLPRMPSNMDGADPNNPFADYDAKKLYAFLADFEPDRLPGSQILYSNLGVALLGHVLTRAAHESYDALLHERIAGPLGMTSTSVNITPALRGRIAPGHFSDGTPAGVWDFQVFAGAGAIRSTGDDMLRFVEAQLHPPADGTGEAIEMAWKIRQDPIAADDFAVCLGWHVARDGSTRWHNGQTGGYHSEVMVSRVLGVGVVVLSGTASFEVDVLTEALIRMLAGAVVPPRTFEQQETVEVPLEVMERYVGQYQLMPGMVFTVTVENGNLMVGLTGQPSFRVFPRSETEWFYRVVDAQITFELDEEGNCTGLEIFQNGAGHPATRVE